MLHHAVCQEAPNTHHCEENFPEFWRAVAMRMFDGQHGWFAPRHFCHVRKYGPCRIRQIIY